MEFDADAFISYAHLDNIELVEGRRGWVANLHRALEVRVGQLLGKHPRFFRDPKLQGNDIFADALVERLRRAAALVTVITPRYVKSEWTLRELREFRTMAERRGGIRVGDRSRVFKVLKTPIPPEEMPPELRDVLGYEFFTRDDETGKIRELDEIFGPDAQREFWSRLYDLAADVCEMLKELEAAGEAGPSHAATDAPATAGAGVARTPIRTRTTVFLAEATSDLREERDALRRDLQQHGYTVLPDRPLPLVTDEAERAIREDLARCGMSIHLIGSKYGIVPEGGLESLVELQHELATERARGTDFPRIVWIPAGLQVQDERQHELIERLRLDRRIASNADLLETFFEDLRTVVHRWLERAHAVDADADDVEGQVTPQLYLIADRLDADMIRPWDDALFREGLEVVPSLFDGDEADIRKYHEENLAACDGVLIFYGCGNEAWVRRKLRELQKSPGYGRTKPPPVTAICLLPPRSPEKERFRTHDALVVRQWDGYRAEPWQDFIAQLEAGRPV